MKSISKGWKNIFSGEPPKKGSGFHGKPTMDPAFTPALPGEKVIKEIKYFVLFSTLKKLMEQGKITAEYCQQANVAIAEKYGVSELSI